MCVAGNNRKEGNYKTTGIVNEMSITSNCTRLHFIDYWINYRLIAFSLDLKREDAAITPFFYKHQVNLAQPQLCLNILRIEPKPMLIKIYLLCPCQISMNVES